MHKILLTFFTFFVLCSFSYAEFPAVEVYENTSDNVVLIIAKGENTVSMIGSGSIIALSGLIITNAHVIMNEHASKPLSKIRVYLKPSKVTGKIRKDLIHKHEASVVSYNTELDLAILKVDDFPEKSGVIELANPDEIKVGEEVITIGHPEQGGLWTITYGRISGEIENQNDSEGRDVYQTDASINRGNSGGPLLDKRGYMVGMNTNAARLGAGNIAITGVNFAVKSSVIKKWLDAQDIRVPFGKKPMQKETPEIEKPKVSEIETELPQKRPYNIDDIFKEVEEEMEDVMKEMKGKIRQKI